MPQNAMALVIAIKRYPSFGGNASSGSRDLKGPVNDATTFIQWLKSQGIPDAHIFDVTSDDFPAAGPIGPALADLTNKLDDLIKVAKEAPAKERLYIYVSGHGYGRRRTEGGLYLADATPDNLTNLFVTDYFHWFMDAARFKECILFYDACMDQGRLASPAPIHWRREVDRASHNIQALGIFAARFAGRAVERTMENGKDHGAFSYALKMALDGAAAVDDGQGNRVITSESLRDYLIATMQKLMTDDQRQHPLVSTEPDFGPFDSVILVKNAPPFLKSVQILLPGPLVGKTLILENAKLKEEAQIDAIEDSITLDLSPGLYVLSDGTGWERAFEFTGAETEIDLQRAE